MRIIDDLCDVQSLLTENTDYYDITIDLIGNAVLDRYPLAKITVNDKELWKGPVTQNTVVLDRLMIKDPTVKIQITYLGKTEQDTIVNGETILENQTLSIQSIEINGIRIPKKDLMYMGVATYDLTESQKIGYTKIGAPWVDVKTDTMYNNGVWTLEIKKPILSNLIALKKISNHVFEVSHQETLARLQKTYLGS